MVDKDYDPCCPNCGDNSFDWIGDGIVECANCDTRWDTGLTYEEIYGDGEPGCAACGDPNYPKCKDSCPMFDY